MTPNLSGAGGKNLITTTSVSNRYTKCLNVVKNVENSDTIVELAVERKNLLLQVRRGNEFVKTVVKQDIILELVL